MRTKDESAARQLASYLAHDFHICLSGVALRMNQDNLRRFLKKRFERLVNSYKLALLTFPGYNLDGIEAAYDAGYIEHGNSVSPEVRNQLLDEAKADDIGVETEFDLAVLQEQTAIVAKQSLLKAAEFSRQLETFQVDEAAAKQEILDSGNYIEFPEEILRYHLHCLMQYREVEKDQRQLSVAQKLSRVMETGGLKDPTTEPLPTRALSPDNLTRSAPPDEDIQASTVRELIDTYFEIKADGLGPRTKKAYQGSFNRLAFFMGDGFDLSQFSHKIARSFESFLRKAPPNVNIKPEFRDLSRDELLEYIEANPELPSIGPETLKNHITRISALFEFGKKRGFVETNFFEGWANELTPKKAKPKVRKRFTDEEVLRLLPTPEEQVDLKYDFSKFLCHLGAYTGMRLEEICSLRVGNIEEIEGILVFNLGKGFKGQDYKTENAMRIIPVHKELFASGFVDYWKDRSKKAAPSKPLFVDLSYTQDQFSRKASRWFNERHGKHKGWKGYKNIESTDELRLNFHSFRHTVISKLLERERSATLHVIQYLVGHGQEGVTINVYGSHALRDITDLKTVIDGLVYG